MIQIQLLKKEMQIGAKGIKNVLVTMVLKRKETLKWQILEKTPLHSSLLENCLSRFQFGILIKKYDLWKAKAAITKPTPINHLF